MDGFPCLVGAKADAEWTVVRPALAAHENLTLLTRATVQRLITDVGGHSVTGVQTALADGSVTTFGADVVVLSAGSILSAVLLLKSADDAHPNGLANSSDVVGRHYMRHNNLALMDVAATAHQAGTVRFGTDPRTSALDVDCKAHDLDNLYVVDGSFMPSIGAVNPTLTIIANALRVSEHIANRMAARA